MKLYTISSSLIKCQNNSAVGGGVSSAYSADKSCCSSGSIKYQLDPIM